MTVTLRGPFVYHEPTYAAVRLLQSRFRPFQNQMQARGCLYAKDAVTRIVCHIRRGDMDIEVNPLSGFVAAMQRVIRTVRAFSSCCDDAGDIG